MIKLFFIPETLRKGGLILFQVDMKSRKSIYEQVVDNVKELIVTGLLPAESKLPSVRELSRTLTVNPNTIQKAYRELEHQMCIRDRYYGGIGTGKEENG